jgi:sulfoxide reductase heme-binding subunit YedZ
VFVYALLHLTSYVSFELQFDWALIASEVIERPYITVGFIALLDLMLLTITSPMWVRRKMKRNWQRLHNSIYLIAVLALVHFSWSRKTALQEPLLYWFIALVIMLPRFNYWLKRLTPRH